MKSFIILFLIFFPAIIPLDNHSLQDIKIQDNQDNQDSIALNNHDYQFFDIQIHVNDSIGNYEQALAESREALRLAVKEQDQNRQWFYHLKLAKYFYLLDSPEEALKHIRLHALLKASAIEERKEAEMFELEEAYLDEINQIVLEMNMDKTLIENLQLENEHYYKGQRTILNALKIGLGAILFILIIIAYNRFKSKKNKVMTFRKEEEELVRLNELVDKYEVESLRTSKELSKFRDMQQHNLAYARSIQLSLLPSGLDLTDKIRNSFVIYLPKKTISGDFYAIHTNGGKTVLAIFDCPGHGVNAAHSTVITHNLFKEIVTQGITAPSMVLTMMDQKLKRELKQLEPEKEMISGVKMAVCTINQETKEVEYSGAHFPIFYVHLDELHFVKGNQFPIGDSLFSDKFYSSNNLRLSTGDMIYLSTDGYYSQIGGKKNKKFLRSSLMNLLKSIFNHELKEQQFILEKVFHEWKSREEQTDDVLIMGFRL